MNIEQASQIATVVGVLLVVPQIFIAVWSVVRNNRRERIKSTLNYYEDINQKIKIQKKAIKEKHGEKISRERAISIHDENEDISAINNVLNLYERLSLGVNMGIYDLKTINRISGKLLIDNYERFQEYILYRRELKKAPNAWKEFETLIEKLRKMRKER